MSLKKCPACGEYFADTYRRCPFCEEEVNPRKVKKPKRNEDGGRRLSRRDYEEDLPAPIYDDEAYQPRRNASKKHGSREEGAYKGRRSREEAYAYDEADYDEEEENYRPRRSAAKRGSREEEYAYDDGADYDEEEENYRPRRSASKRSSHYDERSYKGRRSREEEYDDEDAYEDDYDDEYDDDYYDDYDDDRGSPWFKVVIVILCAIIIACVLYLARGPIGNLLQLNDHQDDHQQQSSMISDDEPEPPQNPDDITPIVPEVDDPNEENDPQNPSNQGDGTGTNQQPNTPSTPDSQIQPNTPDSSNTGHTSTQPLVLSHQDVTISGGESFTLSVQGSRDSVTYAVKDTSIAKVSSSGTVTGLKKGITEVTVQRGSEKAKCIVRVSSTAAQEGGETTPSTPSGSKLSLSKDDFTLKVGESYTIATPGISDGVTWSISDSSVATVSGGKVSAVSKGTATVTATWNGQKAKCIVRVK